MCPIFTLNHSRKQKLTIVNNLLILVSCIQEIWFYLQPILALPVELPPSEAWSYHPPCFHDSTPHRKVWMRSSFSEPLSVILRATTRCTQCFIITSNATVAYKRKSDENARCAPFVVVTVVAITQRTLITTGQPRPKHRHAKVVHAGIRIANPTKNTYLPERCVQNSGCGSWR